MIVLLLSLIWLLQNFAQLLLMGICIVPNIFVLTSFLFAMLPTADGDRQTMLVWVVFVGGLIWDLRWTNLPGLSAAVGGGLLGFACYFWNKTPLQGRSTPTFAVLAALYHFFYSIIHFLFWTIQSGSALRQLAVQQLMVVPVVVFYSWLFWRMVSEDD